MYYILFTEFTKTQSGLPCGHGFTTPKYNKCIYKLDEYGHIEGCRSLQHLQICGKLPHIFQENVRCEPLSYSKLLFLNVMLSTDL